MALVKCPECGRENVSSQAAACPGCGYGIKEHFDTIRKQEEEKRKKEELRKRELEEKEKRAAQKIKEEERRRQEEEELRKYEEEKRKKEQEELEKIPLPEKPSFSLGMIIYLVGLIFVLLCLGGEYLSEPDMQGALGSVLFIFGGIPLAVYLLVFYREKYNEYVSAINNPTEYRERIILEARQKDYLKKIEIKEYISNQNCKPKCPTCGSTDIKRISTVGRATSVAAVGLASSKIGKQFECNTCKYKW